MAEQLDFDDWWRNHGPLVMKLSGAQLCRWNGVVGECMDDGRTPPNYRVFEGPQPGPKAPFPLPIRLPSWAMTAIEQRFETGVGPKEERLFVDGLHTLLCEHAPLLRVEPDPGLARDVTVRILRTGTDELWSAANAVPAYLRESGLAGPGRGTIRPTSLYNLAMQTAVRTMLRVDDGKPLPDLVRQLVTQPDVQIWNTVAAHLLDGNEALATVPRDSQARKYAITDIGNAMRAPLRRLSDAVNERTPYEDLLTAAGYAGHDAARAGTDAMKEIAWNAGEPGETAGMVGSTLDGLPPPGSGGTSNAPEATPPVSWRPGAPKPGTRSL